MGPKQAVAQTACKHLTGTYCLLHTPYFIHGVPSSSGLGYRPLTPKTRVRFPLGLPQSIKGLGFVKADPFLFACVSFAALSEIS